MRASYMGSSGINRHQTVVAAAADAGYGGPWRAFTQTVSQPRRSRTEDNAMLALPWAARTTPSPTVFCPNCYATNCKEVAERVIASQSIHIRSSVSDRPQGAQPTGHRHGRPASPVQRAVPTAVCSPTTDTGKRFTGICSTPTTSIAHLHSIPCHTITGKHSRGIHPHTKTHLREELREVSAGTPPRAKRVAEACRRGVVRAPVRGRRGLRAIVVAVHVLAQEGDLSNTVVSQAHRLWTCRSPG